jgi:AdoMet-dependent heme synthase
VRLGLRPLPRVAQSARHPSELTTGEPLMVFTGVDPLKRPDLYGLVRRSVRIGLRTNVTPSVTPLLTAEAIDGFKAAGVSRMAISLDGPDAASHDNFRGVLGTFDRVMFVLTHARGIGLDTQLQTTAATWHSGSARSTGRSTGRLKTRTPRE